MSIICIAACNEPKSVPGQSETAPSPSGAETEKNVKRTCLEMGQKVVEFEDKGLEVQRAQLEILAALAAGKRDEARKTALKAAPIARSVISSTDQVQKEFQAKSFLNTLPQNVRDTFGAYTSAKLHFAEIENTRAQALLAYAERGDERPLKRMFQLDRTTVMQMRETEKPIDQAFDHLCFSH